MKTIRIILLVLIVIGMGLLATQQYWMSSVVDTILRWEGEEMTVVPVIPNPVTTTTTTTTTTTSPMNAWNWVNSTTSTTGTQFSYPDPLPTTYISSVDWPPQVTMTAGPLTCTGSDVASSSESTPAGMLKVINTRTYCVSKESEGAAGSAYTTYNYATAQGDFVAKVMFTLRTPQCMNYDEPKQTACKNEQAQFAVDALADRIVESITMQ